jgi:hypothetical protein
MIATVSTVVGLLLGSAILFFALRSRSEGRAGSVWVWTPMVLGLVAAAAILVGMFARTQLNESTLLGRLLQAPVSIALAFAALVAGVGQLVKGDRRWQLWVAAGIGLLPAAFWLWFFVAELVTPH